MSLSWSRWGRRVLTLAATAVAATAIALNPAPATALPGAGRAPGPTEVTQPLDPGGYPARDRVLDASGEAVVTPAGGTAGRITATGTTTVAVPFLEYSAQFRGNASRVAWLGTRPLRADSIQHTDTWSVDYVAPGYLVFGAPTGAVVHSDGASTEVAWTTTAAGTWYSEHSWANVAFFPNQYGQLYRLRYAVTGVFQFGSAYYTVTGTAVSFT